MRKRLFVFPIMALWLAALLLNPSVASAGDGSNGAIDLSGITNVISGATVSVKLTGLDVSSDYQLNYTGDNTGFSWTTGSSQTKATFHFVVTKPAASTQVIIYLRAQSAGTSLDSASITVQEADDLAGIDLVTNIAFALLVPAIIVAVLAAILRRKA